MKSRLAIARTVLGNDNLSPSDLRDLLDRVPPGTPAHLTKLLRSDVAHLRRHNSTSLADRVDAVRVFLAIRRAEVALARKFERLEGTLCNQYRGFIGSAFESKATSDDAEKRLVIDPVTVDTDRELIEVHELFEDEDGDLMVRGCEPDSVGEPLDPVSLSSVTMTGLAALVRTLTLGPN